jgi:hypothetical protein
MAFLCAEMERDGHGNVRVEERRNRLAAELDAVEHEAARVYPELRSLLH